MSEMINEMWVAYLALLAAAAWLGFAQHPTAATLRAALLATFRL